MGIRSKISGSDFAVAAHAGYVKGGFGIAAIRQPERLIQSPEQMANNSDVVDFIRKKFPLAGTFGKNCGCDPCSFPRIKLRQSDCLCRWCRQTALAARWTTIIVRYFRMGEPDVKIEMDNRWKPGTVGSIVQKIRRVIAGQRQDGLPRTGKPRGRPKKIAASEPIIPDNQNAPPKLVSDVESVVFTNI